MDDQTKSAILKRIEKGVHLITIQEAFGVKDSELKKLAGLKAKPNKKKTGKEPKVTI